MKAPLYRPAAYLNVETSVYEKQNPLAASYCERISFPKIFS